MQLGMIGLGRMGGNMVRRLVLLSAMRYQFGAHLEHRGDRELAGEQS
jgi:6-phosphogluconate dehydrogenase (decarboxylating)